MKNYDLNGKIIFITGAASGLGRCLALKLADKAKRLVLIDKNEEGLNEVCAILKKNGVVADKYVFDFKHIDLLDKKIDEIYKNYQHIDVLFNCAGMENAGFADDLSLDVMREVINVNVLAPFLFASKIIPLMKKSKNGQIINIASDMGKRSIPGRSAYCLSKFALIAFSEALRLELEPYNIDAVTVFPGVMNTNFWKQVAYHGRINPGGYSDKRKRGNPEEVADRIIKNIGRRKRIISKFSPVKIYLFINNISPALGDRITKRYMDFKKVNL